jgi:hypothetical protein
VTSSDHRLAMLITGVYFVLGLLVLLGIDVRRGRRTALREERNLQKRFGGVNGTLAVTK